MLNGIILGVILLTVVVPMNPHNKFTTLQILNIAMQNGIIFGVILLIVVVPMNPHNKFTT
jgi:hypothetical protein